LRIGSEQGPAAFASVAAVAVGSDGSIYVAEGQGINTIKMFDERGRFVRSFGRAGDGPGEFRSISAMGWHQDTLWIADRPAMRVAFFSRDGAFLRQITIAPTRDPISGAVIQPLGVFANGSILGVPPTPQYRPGTGMSRRIPLYGISGDRNGMTVVTNVDMVPAQGLIPTVGGLTSTVLQVPRNSGQWSLSPDGSQIVVLRPSRVGRMIHYAVEVLRPDQTRIAARTLQFPVRDLRPSTRAVLDRFTEQLRGLGVQQRTISAIIREVRPEYEPVLGRVLTGVDGTIWIWDYIAEVWLVFGNDLQQLGTLRRRPLQPTARVLAASRRYLWWVEHDNLGTPYVVRARVVTQ
jgi:hypothetical protein